MNPSRRRAGFASLLMITGAALGYVGKPSKNMADEIGMPDLEAMFPKQFGEWSLEPSGAVILPSPYLQSILDKIYNQTLARTYVNTKGSRIMLSVAYGGDQSDGTSAHRPEVCYPAQGFAITANTQDYLQLPNTKIPVRRLMSVLGPRQEPITYWVIVGDEVVTTGVGQKLAQMRYGLRNLIADGMLVRVSSIDADMKRAYNLHTEFLLDLYAGMAGSSADRVFGRAG
ncbi:exosortase-associated protein EpsI, B-type [Aquincola sp. MAHUQ-54]|uniref:Exosortase-associated protein EpsI, B-type n=1 Tax=Aquincola agrisoli TaxID=3119538 RepID=A0AAW9QM75_9BURK